MSEQPEQTPDGPQPVGEAEGTANDATVKTENNTGGFKPGRDDIEKEDQT